MKFGKLTDISDVDFSLAPTPAFSWEVLEKSPPRTLPTQCLIGCTGWSMKEWVGKVYPKGTKAADFLKHYARQFATIELNTTHYRIPTPETIDKWYEESTPDFRFCPKIPQTISHSRNLGLGTEQFTLFCDAVAALKEKLGCCFIQLPPYFGLDRLPVLEAFLTAWPAYIPIAVEVRHESWFETKGGLEAFLACLQQHGQTAVITDVAGRRDVAHMGLSSTTTMIRFVGNGLHPTDYTRMDAWVERLKEWSAKGLQTIYFFPHEPDNILAPDLSVYLHRQVAARSDFQVRGPELIDGPEPGDQMALF